MKWLEAINGWKTYIASALGFVYALVGGYLGYLTFDQAGQLIVGSAALIGIGHKLDKLQRGTT